MTDEEMAGGLTDEQMMAPEEGGPESFLHPDKFKPSPQHRKLKNTGPIEKVRSDLDIGPIAAPSTTESIAAPIADMLDKASLGAVRAKLASAPHIPGSTATNPAEFLLHGIDRYRRDAPLPVQIATSSPAYISPNTGPSLIATGVGKALARAPVNAGMRAILGAAGTGAGIAGAESIVRGDSPMDTLRETVGGGMGGAAIGGPLAGLSMLTKAAANTVLGSEGAKAREFLESRGQPLTAANTTDEAIGAAAQRRDQAVKEGLWDYRGQRASEPYAEAVSRVTPEQARELVDVTPLVHDMVQSFYTPGIRNDVATALKQNLDLIEGRFKRSDGSYLMTQEGLNNLRAGLADLVDFNSRDPRQRPLLSAFTRAKELVDQGPYAEANRLNTEGMADFNESLKMTGLKESGRRDEPISGNLAITGQRQGQNTVTAGRDTEKLDLDAFRAKHPELANALDEPEIVRKQADLAFNMTGPSHGGFMERYGLHLSPFVAAAIAASGHGLKGAAAVPLALALQNRKAIAGRLLYEPAQTANLAAQMLLGEVPQLSAPGAEFAREKR